MADEPLLLHSLSEHGELIFAALDAARPRRVIEIGSETGGFSKELLDWAGRNDATLVTVEPNPAPEVRELASEVEHFELVIGRSPGALADLEPGDAYVIDGDHNYWTVLRELEAAFASGEPLAILHDVAWPCARRDQYYAPDRIPPEGRHPYDYENGRDPDSKELVATGGFHGEWQFAVARTEGGARNGVLTAVEDFLSERRGLLFRRVEAVFGTGYLFSADTPYADQLCRLLDPWHENKLVGRLERNRVRLYARVLELQDELRRSRMDVSRALLGFEDRIEALEGENAALRLERQRLRASRATDEGTQLHR